MRAGVSIIIKALNEEQHIECAIRSGLDAVTGTGGEVILADSLSSDTTIELAARHPITITQLVLGNERRCGVGPQLGFQEARGDCVYLMDGDMELLPGFLEQALAVLRDNPRAAGVGGQLVEPNQVGLEYEARRLRKSFLYEPGIVTHLTGGGLYRVAALREVGYLSDRNLHGFEEYELGLRLRHAGWELRRIAAPSIRHSPHTTSPYKLLWRRYKRRDVDAPGELIRASLKTPYLKEVFRWLKYLMVVPAWWALIVLAVLLPSGLAAKWSLTLGALALPVMGMTVRRGGRLALGLYSVVTWVAIFLGAVRGLLGRRVDPRAPIERRLLKQGEWFTGANEKGQTPELLRTRQLMAPIVRRMGTRDEDAVRCLRESNG
jgi:GT2 family glycosyltransferase